MTSALVTHYSTHSGCNCALLLILQLLSVMSPYKSDEEHLPEADLPYGQEVELPKVVCKVEYDGVPFGHLCLLTADEDQIVVLRLREDLLHFEHLLLTVHVEGH